MFLNVNMYSGFLIGLQKNLSFLVSARVTSVYSEQYMYIAQVPSIDSMYM